MYEIKELRACDTLLGVKVCERNTIPWDARVGIKSFIL